MIKNFCKNITNLFFFIFFIFVVFGCHNVGDQINDPNSTSHLNTKKPINVKSITQPKTFNITTENVEEVDFSISISKPVIKKSVLDPHKPTLKPLTDTIKIDLESNSFTNLNNVAPKIYKIPKKGYNLQHGDTIYALKKIQIKFPKTEAIKSMNNAFNSFKDLKYLNKKSGLPTSNYRCVIEDSRNYMWFGTVGKGLVRYDGSNYLHFNKNNGLNINYVNCLFEDNNQNIWIGSKEFNNYKNKIIKYDGYHFYEYTLPQKFSNYPIRKIFEDSKGSIWIATEKGGVFVYHKNDGEETITHYTQKNGLLSDYAFTFWKNNNGDVWIGTGKGISIFDGKKITSFSAEINFPVKSILQDNYDNKWFSSINSIYKYDGNSIIEFKNKEALQDISEIKIDQNDVLWIGNWESGLTFFNGQKFGRITNKNGLNYLRVSTLINDGSGSIWFSNPGGMFKLKVNSFNNYPIIAGLSNKSVTGFSLDNSNNLWIASREVDGLIKYDYSSFQHYLVDNSQSSFVYADSKDNVWFGAKKGAPFSLAKFDGESVKKYTIKGFKNSNKIMNVIEDEEGALWIASLEGLYKFQNEKLVKYLNKNRLANRIIKIKIDKKGNKWLATRYGISKFDEKQFVTYTTENNLPSNFLINFMFDNSGNLFISTDEGLSLLSVDKNNNTLQKSYNYGKEDLRVYEYFYTLLEDQKKNVWISTSEGVNRLTPTNEIGNYTYSSFTKSDGFLGENGILNAVIKDHKNIIWWGTSKGLINIDSSYKFEDKEPKVHINEIEINQEIIDLHRLNDTSYVKTISFYDEIDDLKSIVTPFTNSAERLKLPYQLNHLKFKFSGIDWSAQENVKFTYKLKGNDTNWSELSNEKYAEYRDIKPGTYTFQVKAISKSGYESQVKMCKFTINPAWWLTIWAKIIYCILALLLIYLISQVRINVLNKKIKEKENLWAITHKQNKRFKDFSFVTSHNIRIAASNLTGLHNLLRKNQNDEEILNMLAVTDNKLQNSIEHINQLLNIDELSCEKNKQFFSVKSVIDNIIQENEKLIEKQQAKITVTIPVELEIYSVISYFRNIMHQIIKNALLFGVTTENKTVEIYSEFINDNAIAVNVKDYGPGIDLATYHNKIFTLGGRFHPNLCDGEGLGLYISKNQVDTLGGDIIVDSVIGKGATFRILFYDQKKEDIISR